MYTYLKEDLYMYVYIYIYIARIYVYVYKPKVHEAYKMWASWQGR